MKEITPEMHEEFIEDLKRSQIAVNKVAEWFKRRGHTTRVPELRIAPTPEERLKYADGGDLFVEQRFEVKYLTYHFTGREDWPFGEKYIVCPTSQFDLAKPPKPYAYFCCSDDLGAAGIVLTETKDDWYIEKRPDKITKRMKDYYFAPMKHVHFVKL